MDILIIGARRYPPGIGGIERYIYEFSKVASDLGHNLTIITQRYPGEKDYEKIGNIEVIRCFTVHKKPFDQFFLFINTILKKKGDYDVYWGHGVSGTLIDKWKPYVHTMHGFTHFRQDKTPPFNYIAEWLEYRILERTDMNIAVDKQTWEISKEYNENSYLVENGIDIERFKQRYDNPYDEGKKNVLFVGRLERSKGIIDIINGFRKFGKSGYILHIVGDGLLHDEVRSLAKKSRNIKFHGRVDSVEEYFQHADCYVLPSYHEGFPTTVLEAMAAKRPTVVTDLPAFEGNFEDGVETMIFEPGDVEGMMEKIELVLKDDSIYDEMVSKAYQKVKEEYTWEVQTKKILSLFEDLIKESQT